MVGKCFLQEETTKLERDELLAKANGKGYLESATPREWEGNKYVFFFSKR